MGFHRPLAPLVRGTEDAEKNNFSIAAFSAAMEKYSAALLQKKQKASNSLVKSANNGILLSEGLSRFIQSPSQRLDRKITTSANSATLR
jgi:hypothetical protein